MVDDLQHDQLVVLLVHDRDEVKTRVATNLLSGDRIPLINDFVLIVLEKIAHLLAPSEDDRVDLLQKSVLFPRCE